MIEIRNLLFQPLAFEFLGERKSIHLGSRGRKQIEENQVSDEMRAAARRGFISIVTVETTDASDAPVEEQAVTETSAAAESTAAAESQATGDASVSEETAPSAEETTATEEATSAVEMADAATTTTSTRRRS